jgi:hypothetical protein
MNPVKSLTPSQLSDLLLNVAMVRRPKIGRRSPDFEGV